MIWLLAIPGLLLIGLLVVDFQISAPGYSGPSINHFEGKKFINPDKIKGRGLFDMLKLALTSRRGKWQQIYRTNVNFPSASTFINPPKPSITFVNHATFLIQVDGLNILTDPIWSKRASPYSWVGPKRMRPPGIRFDDLPAIDVVLISHNHYDHLDLATVKRLKDEHDPLFITPLGVGQFLNKHGVTNTADLNWNDEYKIGNRVDVNCVPAQHFSGRGVFDRDQTLWCGYVIESPLTTIYFAGDTAYGSFFKEIGERFNIDVSLIPIGAYKPPWFMQPIHTNPDEAIQIHKDVQSTQSIGTHFGTFPLAAESMKEPVEDLATARNKYRVLTADFFVLQEGKTFTFQAEEEMLEMTGE